MGAAVFAVVSLAIVAGCGATKASSPAEAEIAYSVEPDNPGAKPGGGIFIVDGEGKHHKRLTRVLSPDAEDVRWSPTRDLLLFQSWSSEIWTIRPDGRELTKIGGGVSASWSPDGTLIAVQTDDGSVQILSADGELEKTIALDVHSDSESLEMNPSWSPDGTKVAFGVDVEPTTLFVASVSGAGRAVPIAKSENYELFRRPYWSPDGERLAVEETDLKSHGVSHVIWTMRPDGSQRRRVATGASLWGWAVRSGAVLCKEEDEIRAHSVSLQECPLDAGPWRPLSPIEEKQALERERRSPDGRRLADVTAGGALVVSNADGSKQRSLTNPAPDESPAWSPDGARLTFVQGGWVYVIGKDGRGARRLARGDSATWLPDGSGVLVGSLAGSLSVVTLDGKARRLTEGRSYSPFPALSRDGEMVAYLRDDPEPAIYAISTRGGQARKILDLGSVDEIADLAWSSDGEKVFFLEYDDQSAYENEYLLREVALSGQARVVATRVSEGGLAVSPQGGEVAFVGNTGESLEVVDLETRKRRRLVTTPPSDLIAAFDSPQWSPDGSTVGYLTTLHPDVLYALETVRADGSGRQRISAPGEQVGFFSWRPSE